MLRLKNKVVISIFSFVLTLLPTVSNAKGSAATRSPVEVKAIVDKNTVTIGYKIKYVIDITKDRDIDIEPIEFGQNLGSFAIKDFGSVKKSLLNKERVSFWYILDTYVTGKSTIPKTVIKYRKKNALEWSQVETAELAIEVKSILDKAGKSVQMRDIEDPVNLPAAFILPLAAAGLIILIAGSVFVVNLLKKKIEVKNKRLKPAHQIAYEQLEALKNKDYLSRGKIKEYYIEISDIVRHYLENRFLLKAPEMTTEEFLVNVRDYSQLASVHKVLLREFLVCCDLVKFARYAPVKEEIDSVFDSAKMFIDQTKEEAEVIAEGRT